jgi:hypothetical protein
VTAKKRSRAGELAAASIDARVDLVDAADTAAQAVVKAQERAAKIVADAQEKARTAYRAALDGGWTAEQLDGFGVPVPEGEKRPRRRSASRGRSARADKPAESATTDRPDIRAVPDGDSEPAAAGSEG